MKKILFAVLIVTTIIGCKEDKTNDQLVKDPLGIRGSAPNDATNPDKFGPTETDVDEHGFKIKPKSDGPIIIDNTKTSCLWCGEHIGSERNPKIILTTDSLVYPRLFSENQLCGFKCYNEFKNSYFKNNSDEINQKASGSIYRIKIISK
jgi:hypothetical protein